jgi:hypothetical protein
MGLKVNVVQDSGDELLDGICDVLVVDIVIVLGRTECCDDLAEMVVSEMKAEEFAVNAIQDGGNEVVDGIVMGRVVVQCMMWLRWNVGVGLFKTGGVGK